MPRKLTAVPFAFWMDAETLRCEMKTYRTRTTRLNCGSVLGSNGGGVGSEEGISVAGKCSFTKELIRP